ncbi:HigA family addiction module antidote protein [Duganella sp. FT80W]|uniref:HigA family addiction module antidote protein n=1 Tax=Duganella guangzhouensis TaxID=2666084 RepID=A0A6I2KT85_9BURK|nr:HigA family addiction module antitoxin [Duganella guangzhouensis]MRW89008.1 HigA family addiction module antidote protein [Duganella guangzhouensis]
MRTVLQEIHPGEMLREEFMVPLGLSERELITALDVPHDEIIALLAEQGPVTTALAQALAAHFQMSVAFWENLQADYEQRMKRNGGRQ